MGSSLASVNGAGARAAMGASLASVNGAGAGAAIGASLQSVSGKGAAGFSVRAAATGSGLPSVN